MGLLIVVVLVVGFVAVLIIAASLSLKKRRAAWQSVAHRLGLSYQQDLITGRFEDVTVQVAMVVRSSGNSRQSYTVFSLDIDGDLPTGLMIQEEGYLNKIAKKLGAPDVQLGLPDIDSKLMVKAQDEHEAQEWARRQGVSEGLSELLTIKNGIFLIANKKLSFERVQGVSKPAELEDYIRRLSSCAAKISGH